ncbi:MAG: succinate dehydrogenase, cytochrome b556 subunit [Pseudomonadota bacterium]
MSSSQQSEGTGSVKAGAQSRPLSPHLQIYRWQWTMLYSIMHRASGIALVAALVLIVVWLMVLAYGIGAYHAFNDFFAPFYLKIPLVALSWCGSYHLLNGVRHLVWDIGFGFELAHARISGHTVMAGSVLLTGLLLLGTNLSLS